MYLDCQWPWGPAKAVQSLPTPFKRLLSSTVLPFHLSQVSGSQWDGWAALYLTMYFLSDSVGTLRWWKFKSISKWFIIQWEIQKQQRYWICCFPCFLSKIISGKEHFLLAFFFFFLLSLPGQSSLFPMEDGFLDDGRGDQPLHSGLGSPHCFTHQNGERVERYSRKVFVGGLPPDIDEGMFRKSCS